jgi:hypothetical protein
MKEYVRFRLWLISETAELTTEYVRFRLWLSRAQETLVDIRNRQLKKEYVVFRLWIFSSSRRRERIPVGLVIELIFALIFLFF